MFVNNPSREISVRVLADDTWSVSDDTRFWVLSNGRLLKIVTLRSLLSAVRSFNPHITNHDICDAIDQMQTKQDDTAHFGIFGSFLCTEDSLASVRSKETMN